MDRLPVPGADEGAWGEILNKFLLVAHGPTGEVKDIGVVAAKYVKPSGGIPESDLDSSVQTKLNTVASGASDATTTSKGIVQLAGDLSGTATAPTIATGAVSAAKIANTTITDAQISTSAAIAQSKIANLTTDLSSKVATSAVGAANGVASLDGTTHVPIAQIPDLSASYMSAAKWPINLRDYGAVGDGTTDDTTAVLAWLAAVYDDGHQTGHHRSGYVPEGQYVITANAVFSTFTNTNEYAPVIFGDGMFSSNFILQCGGTEKWFYQNTVNKTNTSVYRDIAFRTDDSTNGNGFDILGLSLEAGFIFQNCLFKSMATAVRVTGSLGGDTMRFLHCTFQTITQKVFHLANNQSVANWFIGCQVLTNSTPHLIYVDGNGGGSTYWMGGTINIDPPADGLPRYLLYAHTTGTALGTQNGDFYFSGLKVEFRDPLARIMFQDRLVDAPVGAVFNQCNLTATTGGDRTSVDVLTARVTFRDCRLANTHLYTVGQTAFSPTLGHGSIDFHGCEVQGEDLSTNFTIRNQGRVTVRNTRCISTRTVRSAEDMDLNWGNSGYGNATAVLKTAVLKPTYASWPESDAGGGRESTIRLPYNAFLRRIVVRKGTSSGGASTYQLFVGNDDKSVTYGSSTSAAQSAAHTITVDVDQYVTTTNDRVVRLWSTDSGSPVNIANEGIAWVEYL